MKYSEIIGPKFYGIQLKEPDQYLIDIFYTSQAHHFWRMLENKDCEDIHKFHLLRHRAHLRAMMMVIYKRGDFAKANDRSHRDLDVREGWNPDKVSMPDPNMNDSMHPNPFYKAGEDHVSDYYLSANDLAYSRNVIAASIDSTGRLNKGKRYAI